MKNGKLITLLKSLSQVEMTRLDKYVHSPYFNVHDDTTRLFDLLNKRYPKFQEKHVKQEAIFEALFPGRPFQRSRLYIIKGYLLKLVYDFIADQAMQTSFGQQKKRDLLEGLSDRKHKKLIPKIIQDCKNELSEYPFRDVTYYDESFQLEAFESNFQLGLQNRTQKPVIQKAVDGLDKFYLAKKLKYACAMINHQQILAVEYTFFMLDEIVSICDKLDLEETPIIGVYYLILMMQKEEDGDPYFWQLRQIFGKYIHLFPKGEALDMYSFAINYCNRQYKGGKDDFLREIFNLFLEMLKQELLFNDPATGIIYYKNIVTLGLKLGEYEWTEKFIVDYKDRLDIQYRESMFNYSLALVCFHQKDYRRSIRHLLKVDFVDEFNRLNYYILLLKTYYESDDIEPLISICHTAITYIRRNKSLSGKNKTAYTNFVKFVRTMARVRYNRSKDKPELHTEIKTCTLLVERNWLLEKSQDHLTSITS